MKQLRGYASVAPGALVARERFALFQGVGAGLVLAAIPMLHVRREKGREEIGEESYASR
jgi:hypothetical protein